MDDELMYDELPSPPPGEASVKAAIDDAFDASLLADVPKMGEAIPAGTYDFRLDSFTEGWSTKEWHKDGTYTDLPKGEEQPYYRLTWRCQQEPYTGRVVWENCPWVKSQDVKDANSDSPRKAEARRIINNRMPRAKEIMTAAGFTPTGKFGFKDFLKTNPEMKLQLRLKARKAKDANGVYQPTNDWDNEVQKHISKFRPQ